jgi:hypothetical protein
MAPTSEPQPARPACHAHGHDRYHHAVDADLKYGGFAWLKLFTGISAQPSEASFRCRQCGEVFETTTDPAILREFRRYPYVERK